ncbi:MAG: trypsin-like peptidase domain-containing protein [Pseudomonadota bacterium]
MKWLSALLSCVLAPCASALQLPAPNIAALLASDANQRGPVAFRFAAPVAVKITPATHGVWSTLDDGRLQWVLKITSTGATSLNFAFTRYQLPPGAALKISGGPDQRGPYTERENQIGQLWTPVVRSSEAILELTVPAAAKSRVVLELSQINHGFRGFGAKDVVSGKSGDCNVDVVCPAGDEWRDEIRSVARYTVGGAFLCTGQLVNNTAQDFTPYFLTAGHCLTAPLAPTTVFYWNYETSSCGGTPDGSLDQTQSGAQLVATSIPDTQSPSSDFTLLQLGATPPAAFRVFYAGWDNRNLAPTGVTAIHHPAGDEKRISFDFDATAIAAYGEDADSVNTTLSPTHLRVADWDVGTTEGGSSGSGLWNAERRLVGTLSGGFAACGNDEPDWYGRLHSHWFDLPTPLTSPASHLDPLNSGAETLDGADPNPSAGGTPTPSVTPTNAKSFGGALAVFSLLPLLLFAAIKRGVRP